jgi:catechol 2,3-dioxygenase-like lactoylglutathione lyase family enzyme
VVAVKDIAFVRIAAPNLDEMKSFLLDFGLQLGSQTEHSLYMRAQNGLPFAHVTELGASRTLGFGLKAQTRSDLDVLARQLNLKVEDNPEPGGGQRVRVTDPAGFIVDVLHGQEQTSFQPSREAMDSNYGATRRRFGKPIRLSTQPSTVVRLGHVALLVPDYRKSMEFYRDVFGMRPSDSYYGGAPENVMASFMHCGLGETYTDHHTVAVIASQDGRTRFDHMAFEVLDMDDLMHGHQHLVSRGYKHAWGIGRHIQGSQVFDYWRDPCNNKIEHWTDGDLVNDSTPSGLAEFSPKELSQWAPPFNPDFFE